MCVCVTNVIAMRPAVVVVETVVLFSSIGVWRASSLAKVWAIVESKTTWDSTTNAMWWIDATVEGKELSMLSLLDIKFLVSQFAS